MKVIHDHSMQRIMIEDSAMKILQIGEIYILRQPSSGFTGRVNLPFKPVIGTPVINPRAVQMLEFMDEEHPRSIYAENHD